MMNGSSQRGEGRVGFLVALAIVGVFVFLGVKLIPVKIAAYEFGDFLEKECRYAAVRRTNEEVAERIMRKAKELDIPLDRKNLLLQRTHNEFIIFCKYEQPIDLAVTTYVYQYKSRDRAPLF